MDDWFERYAAALEERLGSPEPAVHLRSELRNPVLTLARIVAHGTERKNAPLAAYVAGRYVAARSAQGRDEAGAVREALEIAEAITPTGGS
ncbi:MAG: DUF6457 domain-containing protein [Actinomycetota bacterium]